MNFLTIFRLGIVFEGDLRGKNSKYPLRLVRYVDKELKYELVQTLEFDSNRKRMSVIVKCMETDDYILFTKGAESSIFAICNSEVSIEECNKSIDQFAVQGWRTVRWYCLCGAAG